MPMTRQVLAVFDYGVSVIVTKVIGRSRVETLKVGKPGGVVNNRSQLFGKYLIDQGRLFDFEYAVDCPRGRRQCS